MSKLLELIFQWLRSFFSQHQDEIKDFVWFMLKEIVRQVREKHGQKQKEN